MNRYRDSVLTFLVCLAFVVAPLSGCKKDSNEGGTETTTGGEAQAPAPEPVVSVEGDGTSAEECALQTVFFAFDSADLDNSSRAEIQRAVECYRSKGATVRLRLVGATDPRGTEEYNIALGERRAQAVRQYLVSLGVDESKLSVTSVGEELAQGTDESSWAQDRNVSASEN